jgi:hypothetical protein
MTSGALLVLDLDADDHVAAVIVLGGPLPLSACIVANLGAYAPATPRMSSSRKSSPASWRYATSIDKPAFAPCTQTKPSGPMRAL